MNTKTKAARCGDPMASHKPARRVLARGQNGKTRRSKANGIFEAEPEPWPETVNGAELLQDVSQTISHYVVLPPAAAHGIALWVAHTHAFQAFIHTPRLNVTAPEKGCGKTLLLDVLQTLTPKALRVENMTTAVLFRIVDEYAPTLLIDECDTFLNGNEELRGVLNAGHKRGGRTMRCVGDRHDVNVFKTFAPVALAGIRAIPGTLLDRSIVIRLTRAKREEKRAGFDSRRIEREQILKRKLKRWAVDNRAGLERCNPILPANAFNRVADNWRPLFAIAEVAGGEWPGLAVRAFQALTTASGEDSSMGVMLLGDMRALFAERGERLLSADIVKALVRMEDRPWPEWTGGTPITARQVARLLARYDIAPKTLRAESDRGKGYEIHQFTDAFERYLPAPLQPIRDSVTTEETERASVTDRVTLCENQPKVDP